MNLLTRRSFLQSTTRVLAAAGIAQMCYPRMLFSADEIGAGLSDHEYRTLVTMAYDIAPFENISNDIYNKVADNIKSRLVQDLQVSKLIHDGIATLDTLGRGNWSKIAEKDRRSVLERIVTTPFFSVVRDTTIQVVYRDNEVWNYLGYGGNSMKHGGYLHHGFDDIDWLPVVN